MQGQQVVFAIFATLFTIASVIKIICNVRFKNKERSISKNCSINASFQDREIPLSQALKNFKKNRITY